MNTRHRLLMLLLAPIISFSSALGATLTFGTSMPTVTSDAISNSVGAAFDAANIGGSGLNVDGGGNNGATNDSTTYVSSGRPAQGQTFTTGSNPGGYTITSITVQAAGYTNNTATGSNLTSYSLANTSSTFCVRVGRLSGTTFIPYDVEYAASGGKDNPGTGSSANGSGVFLTFALKAPFVLLPNTVYAFDIGTTGDSFEMLGISTAAAGGTSPYSAGTAYTTGTNGAAGATITPQAGDRVFQVNLTAYTPPAPTPGAFIHPGLLNTEADFERMRTNVALGVEPWLSNFNALKSSWMAKNGGYTPRAQATITRSGALNNSYLLYQDVAIAYASALVWKITGDTAYADQAVAILNAWGYTFTAIAGDTNCLLNELYGAEFACVGEMMRNYPGWAPADIAQFQSMMPSVFYAVAHGFLANHNGTPFDHYWVNWDFAAISSLYAIGVLCDNPALTTEATDYFYNGVGNGCIDRAVNFIHPGYLGQGQEMGRDQGHATLDIAQVAAFCQMAWNQGLDLFGYENNRVLAMAEYTAKYNVGQDVPWTNYAYNNWLQTGPSSGSRGWNTRPGWPTLYNHYVNLKGMTAPFTKMLADNMGTGWGYNGDSLGWDQLTSALPPIPAGANPSGLTVMLNGQQPQLSWWGSTYASGYNVKRSTTPGGPYTTIASALTNNTFIDYNPVAGVTNYYVVSASPSGGGETGNSNEAAAILGCPIFTQLNFDETSGTNAADATGNGWTGSLMNGASWSSGKNGNALNLSKASSQYVTLPQGIVADFSDISVSAWVYQNSATNSARLFDFGSGDNAYGGVDPWKNTHWYAERYLYLAPQDGSGKLRFGITHSTGYGEEGVNGTSALPTSQWVHICVTLSGGVGTLYVNGVVVGQNVNMPMTPNQFPPTTQNFIGRSQWRTDPYFDGKIDDFRIYRGGLSTAQVYTLATGLTPPASPSAPTTLSVTAQPGGSNVLNWSAVSGATSYTVRRSTTPGGPYTAIASLLTGTTYTDTGLTARTTYYYVVDAANTGGEGAYSSQASAVALPPIPGAPSTLVASSASSSSIGLVWAAASNAVIYNIKRALTSGGPYTTIAPGVASTSYTDSGLSTGTIYYYVVSAVNAAGEGPNSIESNAAPSNLLMQLKLDETSGTTAWDSTYHGWNGTTVNGPTWTSGKLGNSLTFAASGTNYLTFPAGVVSGLTDFTVSCWVKITTLTSNTRIFDFGAGSSFTSTSGAYMFLTPQNSNTNVGKMRFAISNSGYNNDQSIISSVALTTGSWAHVAITHTGSTGIMYLNGAQVGSNTSMTLSPSSLGSTTNNYIGKSQFSGDPYLDASVDDFRIYTRALSAGEIASLSASVLGQPQNVVATSSFQQVSLSWSAVPNATGYLVRSGTVSGGPYATVASGLATPGLTQSGLPPGVTYYYVVTAMNTMGEGPNSVEVSAGALATPGAPVGINVTAGNGTALLTWTTSSEAASYNVYRSTTGGGDYTLIASGLTGGAYSDTGLDNGTTYYYVVTGINQGGEGPYSAEVSANPNSAPSITSATTLSANYGAALNYQITASNVPTSYGATGLPAGLSVNTSTGVISGSPLASGTYNATISASNAGGTGSATLTISVQVVAPSTPTGLTAAKGDGIVILSWTASNGAAGYNVKRSLTSGTGFTTVASNVTGLNFTNTGLTNGTTYFYVVSAVNSSGESPNSSQVSVTPSTLTADWFTQQFSNNNTTDNTTFTFTPANNANKYIVSRRTGVTQFPTSTTGATNIGAGDDTSVKVTLSGTAKVALYGVSYSSFYIGSNGFITFSSSDTTYTTSITTHFNQPRISALFDDLNATSQGSVTWIQLSDRVAVTWLNVPQYNTTNSNNFQIEMFFDGRIRITFLAVADNYGLIGLSAGGGKPGAFVASTFSNYPAPLAAPIGLAATGSNSAIKVKWSDSTGATSYNVKRTLTSGSGYATIASGVTSPSYSDTGLTNGTTYYYVVSAVNALVREGSDSAEVSATPRPAPSAPTGLATLAGNNLVWVGWNALTGATNYTLWRSIVSGSGYSLVANLSGTSFIDATAINGTAYYYVVTSSNDAGTSGYSNEVTATPVAPPTITSALSATGINGTGLSYQIVGDNTPTSYSASGLPNGLSVAADTGLISGVPTDTGTFNVTITASNFSGTGTAPLVLTVLPPPPTITSPGTLTGIVGSTLNYQIAASSNPASFGASGLPSGLNLSPGTGLITGVVSGTGTFMATVSATNPQGTGSAPLTITILPTPPAAPANLVATGSNASVHLSWTASATATSYNVKRSTTSGSGYTAVASGVTSTNYTDTGLSNGTTYFYVVSASNAGGEGADSTQASATPQPPAPVITSPTSVTGTKGIAFSYQITATNSPASYSASGLPAGLNVNNSTGLISGTPSATGTSSVTLGASNVTGTGNATLTLSVIAAVPSIPTGLAASGSNGSVGLRWAASSGATSYNVKRSTTSGSGYVTVTSTSGLTFLDTGVVNGTNYYYVVSAVNSTGESANSSEVRATPDSKSLIASLRFDETSGTAAADSTGHGWNGNLPNGAGWSTGKINNAVGLVSSGTQYVTLPSGIAKGVTDCTFSVWVKLTTVSNWMRILDFGTGTTTYMFLSPQNGQNSKTRFAITNSGSGGEQKIDASSAIPTGTWTHVAVTLSGSTGTIYLNGIASGTNTAITLTPAILGNTTQNYIGKSQFNDPYLNGSVDQFQFYSRALSPTEIATLAAPPAAPAGVVATGNSAAVAVSWNPVGGATGYSVLRSLTSGSGYSTVASAVSGTSYTDSGLTNGTRYYYQVSALNGLAESSNSSEVTALPDGTPPVITVPANMTVFATGSNGAIVTFSTSANDAISGPCATTNMPPSGSVFPIGTTTVTATAADFSGNLGSTSFTVTVQTLPISVIEQQSSTSLSFTGTNGTLNFAIPVSGHAYQLQYCDDLVAGSWQNYGAPQIGDSANLQFNLPVSAGQSRRFYRIQITR